jgi:hypothetical protein
MSPAPDISSYGHFLYVPDTNLYPGTKPNAEIVAESGATWVRFWVDWPSYQPSDLPQPPDFTFKNIVNLEDACSPNYIETDDRTEGLIRSLDAEIKKAKGSGLRIILTTRRFPLWATFPNSIFLPEDDQLFVAPTDLGINSAWGRWVAFLVNRYGFSPAKNESKRYIDFLEVTNEPNLEMLPQRGMPDKVARMFATAQTIVRNHKNSVKLAGPGTSDIEGRICKGEERVSQAGTPYNEFTRELLKSLRRIGFMADDNFAWSHHNYRDVECDRNGRVEFNGHGDIMKPDYPRTNSVAWVRAMLVTGIGKKSRYVWTGWPAKTNPQLLITEGGARLNGIAKKYPRLVSGKKTDAEKVENLKLKQKELIRLNFDRMAGTRLGKGIAMVSNYLTYTDPCFDSGLFAYIGSCPDAWNAEQRNRCKRPVPGKPLPVLDLCTGGGGAPRPAYDMWKLLPSAP